MYFHRFFVAEQSNVSKNDFSVGCDDTNTGLTQFEEPTHLEYLMTSIFGLLIEYQHLTADRNGKIGPERFGLLVPRNLS